MRLAMIGLGRMGGNMSERLMKGGHEVVVFDRSAEAIAKYAALGAVAATSAPDAAAKMTAPRVVWIMVPAGKPVDDTIASLATVLQKGDVIIDGAIRTSTTRCAAPRSSSRKDRVH
jgi:Predicted 6-phosphogluconate dehydrogenase